MISEETPKTNDGELIKKMSTKEIVSAGTHSEPVFLKAFRLEMILDEMTDGDEDEAKMIAKLLFDRFNY